MLNWQNSWRARPRESNWDQVCACCRSKHCRSLSRTHGSATQKRLLPWMLRTKLSKTKLRQWDTCWSCCVKGRETVKLSWGKYAERQRLWSHTAAAEEHCRQCSSHLATKFIGFLRISRHIKQLTARKDRFGFHRSVSTLLEAGFGEHEIRHRVEILYSHLIKYVKVGHSCTPFPHSQIRVDKA